MDLNGLIISYNYFRVVKRSDLSYGYGMISKI